MSTITTTTTTTTTSNEMHVLDAVRECGGVVPSLKAFAMTLDVPVTRLNNIAKRPISGQVYDPDIPNWDALNVFFDGKISEHPDMDMIALVKAAQENDATLQATKGRRAAGASGANLIDVDGGKMPKRKSNRFEMGSDTETYICFKKDAGVYKIVYQTDGYTCLRPVNENGDFSMELVRVLSNGTLNIKCVPPTEMDKAIEERFTGVYQERHLHDKDVIMMEHPEENTEENTETE